MKHESNENGFALVIVMLLVAVLVSLLAGYFVLTHIDLTTTKSSLDSSRGFYASEGGLNLRAELVRQEFAGYSRPSGSSPEDTPTKTPCDSGNLGTGDFKCIDYTIDDRTSVTYVEEKAGNPFGVVVPRGELFQNLAADEYGYVVYSEAVSRKERTEAVVEMHFHSRLVPVFQFAAFYDKDLEILPDADWTLSGPVHTNGDLYLGGGSGHDIDLMAQVTAARNLYRGRKDSDACTDGDPRVLDEAALREIPDCPGSARAPIAEADVETWDGMIRPRMDRVTAPGTGILTPATGNPYWDRADLRVMLDLNGATPAIEARGADGGVLGATTATLTGCGVITHTDTAAPGFYNIREGSWIEMLDVDMQGLLDCIHSSGLLGAGKGLDDATDGGLILFFGVDGPLSAGLNNYGVRVSNGADLASTDISAPPILGLTVVTNQAVYIKGDYNSDPLAKKPAAFLADSLNVLSNDWNDANSSQPLTGRLARATIVQAAFLAGTDTTGGAEGSSGQDLGQYNGGLESFPRLHEKWTGKALMYRGSFVTLGKPVHVDGAWSAASYQRPVMDWDYDADFDDVANLPPLTPRFVYLEQEMFVRQFQP